MEDEKRDNLMEAAKASIEHLGWWQEESKDYLKLVFEKDVMPEVLEKYFIADVVITGDKVLIKWKKSLMPRQTK